MDDQALIIEPRLTTDSRIRYAIARDGARLAYWTVGQGAPLVYLAGGPWGHVEARYSPECRRWYERLARTRMVVRSDMRGTGWSQRDVLDYSLDVLVADVEAVVDRLGLDRFWLLGAVDAGSVAIRYASRHPERVAGLLLWCSWARAADFRSPQMEAWLDAWFRLMDVDWDAATEACAHRALGWSAGEHGRQAARRLRETITPRAARAALAALGGVDVADLLPGLRTPTLILHRRGIPWLPVSIAQDLAARLPDARLTAMEGESTAPFLGDTEAVASAIDDFLAETEAVREAPGTGGGTTPGASARLTARETEVLRLLAGGRTNREIADELVLSVRTVERHIGNVYGKIAARGRADATAFALTRGLV